MHRLEALGLAVCIITAAFLVFIFCSAPSLTFHDSGELALAAASGGVPHPPGAPTWSVLATLFVHAGRFLDDPARGTNLLSGIWGAVNAAQDGCRVAG